MGLFDRFGAGGGTVTVDVMGLTTVQAGGTVRGTIKFTGGKRTQKITALRVWLTRGAGTDINLATGATREDDGGTNAIGGKVDVTGPLVAEPGQELAFPFELQIPAQIMSSRTFSVDGTPGPLLQSYRVWGTADIPGEIDKHGQSTSFEVTGGLALEVTTSK